MFLKKSVAHLNQIYKNVKNSDRNVQFHQPLFVTLRGQNKYFNPQKEVFYDSEHVKTHLSGTMKPVLSRHPWDPL